MIGEYESLTVKPLCIRLRMRILTSVAISTNWLQSWVCARRVCFCYAPPRGGVFTNTRVFMDMHSW